MNLVTRISSGVLKYAYQTRRAPKTPFCYSTMSTSSLNIGIKPLTQEEASRFPPIVFVLGGPGSGKGTQCEKFLKQNAQQRLQSGEKGRKSSLPPLMHHVNVGGLLRSELQLFREQTAAGLDEVTPFGRVLEEMLSTGQILPSWVTISLMRKEFERLASISPIALMEEKQSSSAVMVDGFPRSVENFNEFERLLFTASRLIVLECDEQSLIDRVRTRGEREGRQDDLDIEAVRKRLSVFKSETQDVIRHFEPLDLYNLPKEGYVPLRSVVKIDGSRSVEEVAHDFQRAFDALLSVQRTP